MISIFWFISYFLNIGFEHPNLNSDEFTFGKIIKNYSFKIIISSITIVAGIALLKAKKMGWITSIVTSVYHFINLIIITYKTYKHEDAQLIEYFTFALLALLFLIILILLMSKSFTKKYSLSI